MKKICSWLILIMLSICILGGGIVWIAKKTQVPDITVPTASVTEPVATEETVPVTEPIITEIETYVTENTVTETEPEVTVKPVVTTKPPIVVTNPPIEITEPIVTESSPEVTDPVATEESTGMINLGTYKLTAYCPCSKCCGQWADGITSTGVYAQANHTIAVDPRVIPYGSKVMINGHIYTAEDCGGSIKGNRIDIYFNSHSEALRFGIQYATVYLITE